MLSFLQRNRSLAESAFTKQLSLLPAATLTLTGISLGRPRKSFMQRFFQRELETAAKSSCKTGHLDSCPTRCREQVDEIFLSLFKRTGFYQSPWSPIGSLGCRFSFGDSGNRMRRFQIRTGIPIIFGLNCIFRKLFAVCAKKVRDQKKSLTSIRS